jgi:ribosome biogenesis protein NSA1
MATKVAHSILFFRFFLNITIGISGTVSAMAPAPGIMATTALDRYCRIHSTFPPASNHQEQCRGEVLRKLYATGTPTTIVWGGPLSSESTNNTGDALEDGEDDGLWEGMVPVGEFHKRAKLES